MAYQLRSDQSIIRITFSGTMSVEDLTALGEELRAFEEGHDRTPDRLTDLSAVEARDSTFKIILELARRRAAALFKNPFRSAIVAATPDMAGFARMFRILNRNPQIEVQIFDSVIDAEEWLSVAANQSVR